MFACIQIYVALHVLVNSKVECTSQWDWDVLCGDGVGMVVKCGWGADGSQVYRVGWGWEKNHGDVVGIPCHSLVCITPPPSVVLTTRRRCVLGTNGENILCLVTTEVC